MTNPLKHPALILAPLGAISGILGTQLLGAGIGSAPNPGIYMVFTGLWFGLVVGYAVWRWGNPAWTAAATALLGTWLGWEAAVNIAIQIDRPWLGAAPMVLTLKSYAAGFVAGAVGALITWAGAATCVPSLRRNATVASITATGAVLGLLLPLTNNYDSGIVLLVPWQTAIAALFGFHLSRTGYPLQPDDHALVAT